MANRLADQMRKEIEELTVALRVVERMTTNAHGAVRALAIAEAALGGTRKPRERPRKMKTLPDITVPDGLSLADHDIKDAILLALKAFKRPAKTPELTALLLAGGYQPPKMNIPITRYVGMSAAAAFKTVKKTAKGWAARG
jgi:hypothetical protein